MYVCVYIYIYIHTVLNIAIRLTQKQQLFRTSRSAEIRYHPHSIHPPFVFSRLLQHDVDALGACLRDLAADHEQLLHAHALQVQDLVVLNLLLSVVVVVITIIILVIIVIIATTNNNSNNSTFEFILCYLLCLFCLLLIICSCSLYMLSLVWYHYVLQHYHVCYYIIMC